jgi:hypothetical protein
MSSLNSQCDSGPSKSGAEHIFCEFRRKVRDSELLSTAIEKLLRSLKYTGKLCVVVQNGEILKCGYEEGYFRRKSDFF